MIEDQVVNSVCADAVTSDRIEIWSLAHSEMSGDHVVGVTKADAEVLQANALPRRRLTGDGEVALNADRRGQLDPAADIENDDAIADADGIAEAPGAGVVEIGDVVDRSPASPRRSSISSESA